MSIDYTLTLAGSTPVEDVALRALADGWKLSDLARRPPLWWNDRTSTLGFDVSVRAGTNGYLDAEADDGIWTWKPPAYVAVTFSPSRDADPDRVVPEMVTVVRRVLDTGPEDASFVMNGNWLLLRRTDGRLSRNRKSWWAHYPGAAEVIPDR